METLTLRHAGRGSNEEPRVTNSCKIINNLLVKCDREFVSKGKTDSEIF